MIKFDREGVGWVWFRSTANPKEKFSLPLDQYLWGVNTFPNQEDFKAWFCREAKVSMLSVTNIGFLSLSKPDVQKHEG